MIEMLATPEPPGAKLKNFIEGGLATIKKGEFDQAKKYFKNPAIASQLGVTYDTSPLEAIIRSPLTRETEEQVISFCANKSFHDYGFKDSQGNGTISIADFYIPPQLEATVRPTITPYLQHNLALVHAEEWAHLLQQVNGSPLTEYTDPEIDVAAWFIKQGVPVTAAFMRRNKRNEALTPLLQELHITPSAA